MGEMRKATMASRAAKPGCSASGVAFVSTKRRLFLAARRSSVTLFPGCYDGKARTSGNDDVTDATSGCLHGLVVGAGRPSVCRQRSISARYLSDAVTRIEVR